MGPYWVGTVGGEWGGSGEEAGGIVGTGFYSEVCVGTSKDLLKKDDLVRPTFWK